MSNIEEQMKQLESEKVQMSEKVKELEGQVEQMTETKVDNETTISNLESKMTDMEKENEELRRKLELITKLQDSNHLRGQPTAPQSDDCSDRVDSAWSNAQLY